MQEATPRPARSWRTVNGSDVLIVVVVVGLVILGALMRGVVPCR